MEAFIGSIILFAGNFAPRGWEMCDGRLLSIMENTALFSILGTTYGGDGITTFALPDLRGRVPVHAGNGSQSPGVNGVQLGESAVPPVEPGRHQHRRVLREVQRERQAPRNRRRDDPRQVVRAGRGVRSQPDEHRSLHQQVGGDFDPARL